MRCVANPTVCFNVHGNVNSYIKFHKLLEDDKHLKEEAVR